VKPIDRALIAMFVAGVGHGVLLTSAILGAVGKAIVVGAFIVVAAIFILGPVKRSDFTR
jgi:hypothetical protein